jgi:hypothetical protein
MSISKTVVNLDFPTDRPSDIEAELDGMTPAALTLVLIHLKAGAVRRHAAS